MKELIFLVVSLGLAGDPEVKSSHDTVDECMEAAQAWIDQRPAGSPSAAMCMTESMVSQWHDQANRLKARVEEHKRRSSI